jgi:GNAT superfamily N-acetyltransferase
MNIRKLKTEDIPKVAEFEKEISLISFADEAIDDTDFYIKKLNKFIVMKDNYMYVAVHDELIVGWLWFAKRSNFITNEVYIDFKSFYIVDQYRSLGVSDLLMSQLLEIYKSENVYKMVGRVETNNLEMRLVYKKYGFIPKHITMEYRDK